MSRVNGIRREAKIGIDYFPKYVNSESVGNDGIGNGIEAREARDGP